MLDGTAANGKQRPCPRLTESPSRPEKGGAMPTTSPTRPRLRATKRLWMPSPAFPDPHPLPDPDGRVSPTGEDSAAQRTAHPPSALTVPRQGGASPWLGSATAHRPRLRWPTRWRRGDDYGGGRQCLVCVLPRARHWARPRRRRSRGRETAAPGPPPPTPGGVGRSLGRSGRGVTPGHTSSTCRVFVSCVLVEPS